MAKLLTGFQRSKSKVDEYLFGEDLPLGVSIAYYGYYVGILAVTGGLCAVVL